VSATPQAAADPQVEAFLALLAARRSPRTVEAYRRDLERLARSLDRPLSEANTAALERAVASLRAEGLSPATLARRIAAARTFYAHLQLLGLRADNPAAEIALPRRVRRLPPSGSKSPLCHGAARKGIRAVIAG